MAELVFTATMAWVTALVGLVTMAGAAVSFHKGAVAKIDKNTDAIKRLETMYKQVSRIDRLVVRLAERAGIDSD